MQKNPGSLLLSLCFLTYFSSCGPSGSRNSIATDSLSIADGAELFQKNCSICHGFKQNGIGPDLSGVTETDSVDWLRRFIRNPKTIIDAGDKRAAKLLATYKVPMPSFPTLSGAQIDLLIAFMHTHKGHGKKPTDSLAIKDPVPEKIASSGIQVQLDSFSQMPATSDKQPLTRISKMDWVPAAKSWFVLDQRGKIYKLENGKSVVWLDISKWKPKFINEPGLATGLGSFAFHPDFVHNGIFYTTHTESPHTKKADFAIPDSIKTTLQWVICEWKIDHLQSASSFTCRELFRIDMVSGIHGLQ